MPTGLAIAAQANGTLFDTVKVEARGQLFDAVTPASGVSVTVFQHVAGQTPGSTSSIIVYADEQLTTPLSQPLTTDSEGRVPGYISAGVLADLVCSGGPFTSRQVFVIGGGSVASLAGDASGPSGANVVDTVLGGQVPATATGLASEATARAAADTTNANAIASEATARTSGDAANAAATAGEVTRATNAENALSAALATEASARAGADTTNASAIAAEATARASADTSEATARAAGDATNAAAVTTEATTRAAADTTNANAISAEATTRAAADATNAAAIASEATARAAADTTNANAIAAEATTRAAADTTNANAISAEATTRAAADTANANATAAEVTRATAAEAANAAAITTKANLTDPRFVPAWTALHNYTAGDQVINPFSQLVVAADTHTSASTYGADASHWAPPGTSSGTITSVNGHSGPTVTLTYSDVGADQAGAAALALQQTQNLADLPNVAAALAALGLTNALVLTGPPTTTGQFPQATVSYPANPTPATALDTFPATVNPLAGSWVTNASAVQPGAVLTPGQATSSISGAGGSNNNSLSAADMDVVTLVRAQTGSEYIELFTRANAAFTRGYRFKFQSTVVTIYPANLTALSSHPATINVGDGIWARSAGNVHTASSAPLSATLTAPLNSGGGPITTIPATVTAAIANGATISLASDDAVGDTTGHLQTWVLTSAASPGNTVLHVQSQTPAYSFPTGSSVLGAWAQILAANDTTFTAAGSPGFATQSQSDAIGGFFAAAVASILAWTPTAVTLPSVAAATATALGTVEVTPAPNVAATPVALGSNTPPQALAQNGAFPLPPTSSPTVNSGVVRQDFTNGLPAGAQVIGNWRPCNSTDQLYPYLARFIGSAPAVLIVQSASDALGTNTVTEDTRTAQQRGTGSYGAESRTPSAPQSYMRTILATTAAQTSVQLADGPETLAAS